MTSIIKVDTIQNKAGSTTLDADKLPNMYNGSARVWISDETLKVDTAGAWTGDSFGVSSITDHATGQAHVNFTNSFANTGFCSHATASGFSVNDIATTKYGDVTTARDEVYIYDGSYKDSPFNYSALGDLA